MLGRSYSLSGIVCKGNGLGTRLGFKTANLNPNKNLVLPSNGVYLTELEYKRGKHKSLTYVGTRPTISTTKKISVETHVLRKELKLHGKRIKVLFIKKLRNDIKFSSLKDLQIAIRKDVKRAV